MNAPSIAAVAVASLAALATACASQKAEARRPPAPPPLPHAATQAIVAAPAPAPEPPGLRDQDLGLARGSVFEPPSPPAIQPERSEPGEKPVVPRAFPGAPPVAPHELVDYTPITRAQNACLDCHQIPGPKEVGQPTPVPPSHYLDLRRSPAKPGKTVTGARWVCTACHLTRSDQGPLVTNPGP
jgi:cytochrome c-type protein NapB